MTKYRFIIILSISALIPLFLTFIFPVMKHESQNYYVTYVWIWGLPIYSSFTTISMMIPFMLFSIGIVVEIVLLLKSYFNLKKDNAKVDVVSRDWIKRGRWIIIFELMWILWLLFLICIYYPFGIYYIEVPIFLPIIGGLVLIIAGNLSKRIEIDKESALNKESDFKTIHGLYIFVFIFYSIFFSLFFALLIFPAIYFSNEIFFRILFSFYFIYPMLLIILILVFDRSVDNIIINSPRKQKQLKKLYILTLAIIGISILIYFLLNWIRPTIRMFWEWFD
ncbi:MAG: hypothetical protein HWN81_22140 [Candidatus Lokiarchaeota archaeon]|nr:hypothetical protein [Candidatus Lokiarchaeota archaeon]